MERKGDPRVGYPAEWDDKRDDAINTSMQLSDFQRGEQVEVWFRGFWWRCSIFRFALRTNSITVPVES
jgi:hypothetical protein